MLWVSCHFTLDGQESHNGKTCLHRLAGRSCPGVHPEGSDPDWRNSTGNGLQLIQKRAG